MLSFTANPPRAREDPRSSWLLSTWVTVLRSLSFALWMLVALFHPLSSSLSFDISHDTISYSLNIRYKTAFFKLGKESRFKTRNVFLPHALIKNTHVTETGFHKMILHPYGGGWIYQPFLSFLLTSTLLKWILFYSTKEERHTLYWFCCLVMEHYAVWKICSKVFVDKNYVDYVDQNDAIEHRKLDAQRVFGYGLRSCLSYSWLWKISRRRGCPGWAKGPSWDILDWKSSTPKGQNDSLEVGRAVGLRGLYCLKKYTYILILCSEWKKKFFSLWCKIKEE